MSFRQMKKRAQALAREHTDDLIKAYCRALQVAYTGLSARQIALYTMADWAVDENEHYSDKEILRYYRESHALLTDAGLFIHRKALASVLDCSEQDATNRALEHKLALQRRAVTERHTLTLDERFLAGVDDAFGQWITSMPAATLQRYGEGEEALGQKWGEGESTPETRAGYFHDYMQLVDDMLAEWPEPKMRGSYERQA